MCCLVSSNPEESYDPALTWVTIDTELKAKIEAFKAERRGRKEPVSEQMDTSAD
jgi:hypothetical protein